MKRKLEDQSTSATSGSSYSSIQSSLKKPNGYLTVFIPFFVEHPYDLSKKFDFLLAATHGNLCIDISFHTQKIDWAQIAEQINVAQKKTIRQVGLTREEAAEIVNQHSWYKYNCAAYFVEANIKIDNINKPFSESSLDSNWLNAGRKAYHALQINIELNASNLVAVHTWIDERYSIYSGQKLIFPQGAQPSLSPLLLAPNSTGDKKKDFQYYLEKMMVNTKPTPTFVDGLFSLLVGPNDSAASYFMRTPEERLAQLNELSANKAFTDVLDQHHGDSYETSIFLEKSLDNLSYLKEEIRTYPLGQNYIPSKQQLCIELNTMMGDLILNESFAMRLASYFYKYRNFFSSDTSKEVRTHILQSLNEKNTYFHQFLKEKGNETESTKFLLKSINQIAIPQLEPSPNISLTLG